MQRVFAVDVLECPSCHGRMKIIAIVQPPDDTREILESMSLASRAPPLEPASLSEEGDAHQPW